MGDSDVKDVKKVPDTLAMAVSSGVNLAALLKRVGYPAVAGKSYRAL